MTIVKQRTQTCGGGVDTEKLDQDKKRSHLQTLPLAQCTTSSVAPEAAHGNHLMMERPPRPSVGSEKQGGRTGPLVDIAAKQGVQSEEQGSVCVSKGRQKKRSERY
jgi:hypothetical protein